MSACVKEPSGGQIDEGYISAYGETRLSLRAQKYKTERERLRRAQAEAKSIALIGAAKTGA